MIQWTTGYFVSHGTKLHYYRTDGEKPPLVLIHGISDDGLCWTPVAEALAENYDVIMIDVRGHGKSDAPGNGYDYITIATEIIGLLTGLGLEKPVVLGHSMGAMISMTLAGLNPDVPRAIILEDPPAFWRTRRPTQEELEFQAGMGIWFQEVKRKTRDELFESVRIENPEWSEAERGPWADAKHRFCLEITRMLDSQKAVPENFPLLLKQIVCPTLLITADPAKGAILTDEDLAELKGLVPHLKWEHIPRAGHNIRREQFSRYMEVVNIFLNSVSLHIT